jgi:hypothetical protein
MLPAASYLAMASQPGSLWLAEDAGGVQRVDAITGEAGGRFDAPRSFSLTVTGKNLWVLATGPKGSRTASAVQLDPTAMRTTDTVALPVGEHQVPESVIADGDALWVPDGADILRIQPS